MNLPFKLTAIALLTASVSACTAITDFTSSTSSTLDAITPDITVNEFVNKRYVAIRHDAANGGGENLQALAQLMGKDQQQLASLMQQNFDSIFSDVEQPADIIARIESSTAHPEG